MCHVQQFLVVWIFSRSLGVICYDKLLLSEDRKNYFKNQCLMCSQSTFPILTSFWLNEMVILKARKPDNFESHNSLKVNFTNIWGLRLNFVQCESFLESKSSVILVLCETNLDDSIYSRYFSVRGYFCLIRKNSLSHVHGLALYVKEGYPFARNLSLENSQDSYLYFRLALLHWVSYFVFFYRSPSSSLCTVFMLFHLT